MTTLLMVFVCLGLSMPVLALQLKPVLPNHTVTAIVAVHHPSRLTVKHDRIATLYGTPGAYTTRNDNRDGQVYLMPTPAYHRKAFTLFITTEKRMTYAVNVTPKPVLGQTIVLVPRYRHPAPHHHVVTVLSHTSRLLQCLRHMHEAIHHQKPNRHYGKVHYFMLHHHRLRQQLRYVLSQPHCHGNLYQLTNVSHHAITLTPHDVYHPGVSAIVLQQHRLPAQSSTWLYEVHIHG